MLSKEVPLTLKQSIMFHEKAQDKDTPLYPVMGNRFISKKNINMKGQGIIKSGEEYQIIAFGYGKKVEDNPRAEYWEIIGVYDTTSTKIKISKKNMHQLYDTNIIEVL
jgi:hypothetical protein